MYIMSAIINGNNKFIFVVVASGTGEPTEESAGQAPKLLTVAMSV